MRPHEHGHGPGFGGHGPAFGEQGFGGRGFGGHGPGGRGPRGRSRRGNVRAAILALLAERPMHGYEMIQELQERTGGLWRPSPGSIYPALALMEDEGLLQSTETTGKRRFQLTEAGRAELDREPREQSPWDEVTRGANPSHLLLRDSLGQVVTAARQVMQAGSEQQGARALDVLAETKRKLYAILAEQD
jgi:DNA-binding PadR family transcriptional regulator